MAGPVMRVGVKMLLHDRRRLALSTAGIAFAVVIMFLQLGFFNGINDSQAHFARLINADLVVVHLKRTHLNKWNRFNAIRTQQIAAVAGIAEIIPILQDGAGLKNPQNEQVKRIIVYAVPPDTRPFTLPQDQAAEFDALKVKGNVLFDRRSRDIYGSFTVGDTLFIDGRPFRLAGFVDFGPNLVNDGGVLVGRGSWEGDSSDPIIGLIRLAPGYTPDQVAARIRAELPSDIVVMTPRELAEREVTYTITSAPVGAIFGIGLVVSLFIGTVICYQILYNEVTDNLSQYATLKAMGFSRSFLIGIIVEEAAALSVVGFVPGFLASLGIYALVEDATRLIMDLTAARGLLIFVLTLIMCLGAAVLAVRKVLSVDPADLY